MIEAGIPYKEILKKCNSIGFDFSTINDCLITHAHSDHSKSAIDVENHMIRIYTSRHTIEACGLNKALCIKSGDSFETSDKIKVTCFSVVHDCEGSLGFYIEKGEDSAIFINDCYKVDFSLMCFKPKLVLIECNHDDKTTHICYENALKEGDLFEIKRYERILKSHLGVYGCKKVLLHIDLTECKSIILLHLSDRNANEYKMKEEIQRFTDIRTYVAGKNGGIK